MILTTNSFVNFKRWLKIIVVFNPFMPSDYKRLKFLKKSRDFFEILLLLGMRRANYLQN